jgi:hypothetical protein
MVFDPGWIVTARDPDPPVRFLFSGKSRVREASA